MSFKKQNMKWKIQGTLLILVCGLTVAASAGADADLLRLRVTSGVQPGLWRHTFTTIPKTPYPPDQHEQACISAARLQQMLKSALARSANPREQVLCPMTVDSDSITRAAFTFHCPAMNIPQAGMVPATNIPATNIPGEIVRTGSEEHWVMTVKWPATPDGKPATEWRQEYTRLGACKN